MVATSSETQPVRRVRRSWYSAASRRRAKSARTAARIALEASALFIRSRDDNETTSRKRLDRGMTDTLSMIDSPTASSRIHVPPGEYNAGRHNELPLCSEIVMSAAAPEPGHALSGVV